ncbi:hypothetical protein [Paenibacillus soyae]|uniref:EamA domain-containing protein n=1 Tax=Paenibacillus soyae TaxID=2969249 RepID=A0A9X2SAF4_9BACL|nr:hypothetical protein [Paenibacillus soyae]MCR2806211.1 hypothetical protein [Paenibacillus soyae]
MLIFFAFALLLIGLFAVNGIFAYQGKHIDPAFWSVFRYQLKLLPVFFAANLMIGYGIKWLFQSFGNLTFALTVSKGIEIVVCVILGAILLKEAPRWQTYVGLGMVLAGFWVTKWKG